MKAFIWTVIAIAALEAVATCFNLARGVDLSKADRAAAAAVNIAIALWGVYVIAGMVQ